MRKYAFISSISFAFILFILGPVALIAQSELTGEWTAGPREARKAKYGDNLEEENSPEKIYISFSRRSEHGKNQHGTSYAYSDLDGLSAAQVKGGGPVSFRIVREAGTIEAEGNFANGRGSGTFRFVPSASFVSAMRSRGFDFERQASGSKHSDTLEERLFAAATLNVTTALADDLRSANLGDLDVDDLFKAAIFKIDGKFMAEMKATGFPDLNMEDLVKARIFKIDAEYVRQVKDMGFADQGFEGLVKFRIFKVTPEFLNELRAAGLDKMSAEDIVKARIFKIDGEFIRQARLQEPNISMEELVQIKIGVRRGR